MNEREKKAETESFLRGERGRGGGGGGDTEKDDVNVMPFQCQNFFPEEKLSNRLDLKVLDAVAVTVAVLVNYVGFWRGVFGILFQCLNLVQMSCLYFVGSVMTAYFAATKTSYEEHLSKRTFSYGVLRIFYAYTTEMALIFHWAGMWYMMERFVAFRAKYLSISLAVSLAALFLLRSFANTLTAPFRVACLDKKYIRRLKTMLSRDEVILDYVLSAALIAPAVIGYWRGTWNLSDLYLFPEDEEISMLCSLVLGFTGQLAFTYAQHYLASNFHPDKNGFVFYVASRVYTYIFGAVCVNLWRGIWKALELFSGRDILRVLAPTIVSVAFLAAARILRNVSASPFIIAVDVAKGYFAVPTMFKLMGSKVDSLFVLDSLFSVFVVGCLVVFAWRGAWCLLDIFLYPDDESFSSLVSLVLGYVVVLIAFAAQTPMKKCCEKLAGASRLIVLDLYILFSFVGTINVWRGIWNLLNIYFLPESPPLSCWITHIGCFAFLVLINCSNSLLVRGVSVDGEEEGGKCVIFPVSYLRTFFAERSKEKKAGDPEQEEQNAKNKSDITV